MARGREALRRWAVVVAVVGVLVSLPTLVRIWSVADRDRSTADLRTAALASAALGFSGYVQATGGLSLPAGERLGSVSDLLSDRTSMRVWWRAPTDFRVDVVQPSGETDLHRDATGSWEWNYEANTATRTTLSPLSVPTAPDLLPSTLARRLLSEAEPAELQRIAAARIAGRDALGLRIVPAAPAASVGRVDIWVDADSGIPLQVQVLGKGATVPAMDTRFLDFALGMPAPELTPFQLPDGADVRSDAGSDVLQTAGRRLATVALPDTLAGLPRRAVAGAPPAVGLYGRGVTLLIVVPLPYGVADDLRRAAEQDPTAVQDKDGTRLAAGPLGILLADPASGAPYLLSGTVTLDALVQAARALPGLTSR